MKKIFALMLTVMILASSLTMGCALAETPLMGGWTAAEDAAITEDVRALFDKAMEGLVGVNYVPVAYLGSQVVAGTNHAILCQTTVVYPGAQPAWKVVFLYENLEGGVEIMNIADFDFGSLCTYGAEE